MTYKENRKKGKQASKLELELHKKLGGKYADRHTLIKENANVKSWYEKEKAKI